jgi:hypothetical protein
MICTSFIWIRVPVGRNERTYPTERQKPCLALGRIGEGHLPSSEERCCEMDYYIRSSIANEPK